MNKNELRDRLIQKLIDTFTRSDLIDIAYQYLEREYNGYSMDELKEHVQDYFPELLDDSND